MTKQGIFSSTILFLFSNTLKQQERKTKAVIECKGTKQVQVVLGQENDLEE